MKWSVIIPSHNEGDRLDATVQSALQAADQAQTVDLRILVVDDCSDDHSGADVALAYAGESRVQVLQYETRLGVAAARRIGASAADGDTELFLFADAHTSFDLDFFVEADAEIEEDGNRALYVFGLRSMSAESEPYYGFTFNARFEPTRMPARTTRRSYGVPAGTSALLAIPGDIYDPIGGWDPYTDRHIWGWNDYEICLRAWVRGFDTRVVPLAQAATLYRDKFPYGGWDSRAYWSDWARMVIGLLDPEHAEQAIAAQNHQAARAALVELARDLHVVARLNDARGYHVRGTDSLFNRYRMSW